MTENTVKKTVHMKNVLLKHWGGGGFCGKYVFYPIIAKTFHKLFLSIFLYLVFSFQHIKHNQTDLDSMHSNVKQPNEDSNTKCTYLTFDLAVTLIRSFRRGIHPGALCHTPKNISSMDAEH